MSSRLDGKTLAVGMLIGVAAGVAVGYLTAPRSGREMRGLIAEKAGEVGSRAKHMFVRCKDNSLAAVK